MTTFLAFTISLIGGHLITGVLLYWMYRSIGHPRALVPDLLNPMRFWIGWSERAVITSLVILAPKLVPGFVAGWIALKLAATWNRRTKPEHDEGRVFGLLGSVISFAVAIGAGLIASPDSLAAVAGKEPDAPRIVIELR